MTEPSSNSVSCENLQGRLLSIGEVFQHLMTQSDPPFDVLFNISVLSSDTEIDPVLVKRCFHILSEQHQLLRSTICVDEKNDFIFKIVDISRILNGKGQPEYLEVKRSGDNDFCCYEENDFKNNSAEEDFSWIDFSVDTLSDGSEWPFYIHNELKVKFQPGNLLWRIRWLKISTSENWKYVLVFIANHAIQDGKGSFDFIFKQFLPKLNAFLLQKEYQAELQPIKLSKSYEEIFFHYSKRVTEEKPNFILKKLVDLYLWNFKRGGAKAQNKKPCIRTYNEYNSNPKCSHYSFLLNEKSSIDAVKFSKCHGVTVHSLLLVLISSTLKETQKYFPHMTDVLTKFYYPIDMRKFNEVLGKSPLPFGVYFTPGNQIIKPVAFKDREKIIEQCKAVSKILFKQNKPKKSMASAKLMSSVLQNNSLDMHEKLLAFGADNLFSLSNIGNCDGLIDDAQPNVVKIEEYYFSLALPAGTLMSTLFLNKKMQFCIAYASCWVDKIFFEKFEECFKDAFSILGDQ